MAAWSDGGRDYMVWRVIKALVCLPSWESFSGRRKTIPTCFPPAWYSLSIRLSDFSGGWMSTDERSRRRNNSFGSCWRI